MDSPYLSIVLPVFNEEDNVARLHRELKRALDGLRHSYEIIYVDDGSQDQSFQRLSEVAANDSTINVIRLRRNYGQTAALSAGIDRSSGEVIVLLDADLQNDPADIGLLVDRIEEGYDVVSGWRKNRQDKRLTRKFPSHIANALISRMTGVHLHDYGCTLKAYRREVLEHVRLYGEMHRFIPAYASWSGARITEVAVNHRARQFGKSKYGLSRTMRVLLDMITVKFLGSYSTKPLYAFGFVGLLVTLASFASAAVATGQALLPPYVRFHNNPLTLLAAILLVVAIQVVLMGLLAELVMRTYYESQDKPTYIIRSVISDDLLAENAVRRYRWTGNGNGIGNTNGHGNGGVNGGRLDLEPIAVPPHEAHA
jgi:glycosyltransferase involved in cell wall biosynthesis